MLAFRRVWSASLPASSLSGYCWFTARTTDAPVGRFPTSPRPEPRKGAVAVVPVGFLSREHLKGDHSSSERPKKQRRQDEGYVASPCAPPPSSLNLNQSPTPAGQSLCCVTIAVGKSGCSGFEGSRSGGTRIRPPWGFVTGIFASTAAVAFSVSSSASMAASNVGSVSSTHEGLERHLPRAQGGRMPVVGHRGAGKNLPHWRDVRSWFWMKLTFWRPGGIAAELAKPHGIGAIPSPDNKKPDVRENTVKSINAAAALGIDYVEFDVQVTKDGVPVIFHDTYVTNVAPSGEMDSKTVVELTSEEFFARSPKPVDPSHEDGPWTSTLLRKLLPWDTTALPWHCEVEDRFPSLKDLFEQVPPHVGFNIEIKLPYEEEFPISEETRRSSVDTILRTCREHSGTRRIAFSSFDPEAVIYLRSIQEEYPVFYLTVGGGYTFKDPRRNSVAAAVDVAVQNKLFGIVSDIKPLLADASLIALAKSAGLKVMTYGGLNNHVSSLRYQEKHGVDAVIVDYVHEILTASSEGA